ncbi:hypothetical protein JKF63_01172 [Porcisia hertigi]|uniref:GOLD domain-containing protein n=1 Tax=Porcisia hertigi TaxID=2761500 RepID=A0A836L9N6_9TRYP|nr:hypothetical protein JKF63_01172 [Porcisia hertigi]
MRCRGIMSPPIAVAATLLTVVLLLCSNVNGLVFQLESGASRCFEQEVPSGTDLYIGYKADDAYGDFFDASLTDEDGNSIYQMLGRSSGAIHHHTISGGEYSLCLTSRQGVQSSRSTRKVLLVVQIGADAKDYVAMATKEKLRPMEVQMRVMEDTVQEVHNEFMYFRDREAEMRNTNEHMVSMVMWMSVGLTIVFGIFWYLQMRHLKFYFKKKRMID